VTGTNRSKAKVVSARETAPGILRFQGKLSTELGKCSNGVRESQPTEEAVSYSFHRWQFGAYCRSACTWNLTTAVIACPEGQWRNHSL
jgi:hypothetical protein